MITFYVMLNCKYGIQHCEINKRLALRWSGYGDFNQELNARNGRITTGVLILVYSIRVYALYTSALHESIFRMSNFALVYSTRVHSTRVHLACDL